MFVSRTVVLIALLSAVFGTAAILLGGSYLFFSSGESTPALPVRQVTIVTPGIDGEIFLKLNARTEELAGTVIELHHRAILREIRDRVERRAKAQEDRPRLLEGLRQEQELLGRVATLREAKAEESRRLAYLDRGVDYLESSRSTYQEMGYRQYSFLHPLSRNREQFQFDRTTATGDWVGFQRGVLARLDKALGETEGERQRSQSRVEVLTRELEALDEATIHQRIGWTNQELRRVEADDIPPGRIVKSAAAAFNPLHQTHADSRGRFDFDVEPGSYVVVATHDTLLVEDLFAWAVEVEVEPESRAEVLLSQSNLVE